MTKPSSNAVSFERPGAALLRRFHAAVKVPRKLVSPVFRGLEHIPDDRPLLFVGNHVVYSGLDAVVLFDHLLREKGIFLRPLGDHLHFKVPVWGEVLTRFGVVDGTRENCRALMQHGECVLVFPGGAREVAKRRGEKYKLLWGNRLGFAKMAIENGCTVVPYATVGGEEMFDILVDGDDLLASPLGKVVTKLDLRQDALVPLVKGVGPTPIPRPERFYYQFEPPIRVDRFRGEASEANAREVRDRTKAAVEHAIAELLELQANDPTRRLASRMDELLPEPARTLARDVAGFADEAAKAGRRALAPGARTARAPSRKGTGANRG
ncbi:MAG: 1-acyl-sn-glycerol-3-phosphate acyltransferase [Polyangiales bacterium]